MNIFILANLFSLIGASFLAYSTFSNRKDKMLKIQVCDCLFNATGNMLIGSYSAMTTNIISAIRNIINSYGKMTKTISIMISVMIFAISIYINTKGFIGLLPPIASIQYTICSYKFKSAQKLRWALIINLLIWLIHDIAIKLYPSIIIDILIISITFFNILIKKR